MKRDYETMKAIEDLEQNITEYRVSFSDSIIDVMIIFCVQGPTLKSCGRYHLDGELKMREKDVDRSRYDSNYH